MIRKTIKNLLFLSICIGAGCKYNGLEIMTRPVVMEQKYSANKAILFDSIISEDSLLGNYNYNILSMYEGIILEIKPNYNFNAEHWSDVVGGRRLQNKGKWKLEKNILYLENNYLLDKEPYAFKVLQYRNLIFIVPEHNIENFYKIVNANLNEIIKIDQEYENSEAKDIIWNLDFFRECCLIKMKPPR